MKKVAILLTAAALTSVPALEAHAATVTPGAPMRMVAVEPVLPGIPRHLNTYACSLGPVGEVRLADGTTEKVVITAAHCVKGLQENDNLEPEVQVSKHSGLQRIGETAQTRGPYYGNENLVDSLVRSMFIQDWAVVRLDEGVQISRLSDSIDADGNRSGNPVVLTGVRDYPDLAPWQISLNNAGQPICKDGQTSGRSCGTQIARSQHAIYAIQLDYVSGDSGGINFDPNNGEALSVSSQQVGVLSRSQPIDTALQEAYGIPDGQVNDYFSLPESTAPMDDDYRTYNQEMAEAEQWVAENVDLEIPDFRAQFQERLSIAQEAAQNHAHQLTTEVAQGDIQGASQTLESAAGAAAHHSDQLIEAGIGVALQHIIETETN